MCDKKETYQKTVHQYLIKNICSRLDFTPDFDLCEFWLLVSSCAPPPLLCASSTFALFVSPHTYKPWPPYKPVILRDQWRRAFPFKEPRCAADATLSGLWWGPCWQAAVIWGRGCAGCLTSGLSGNLHSIHSTETLAVKRGGAGGVMALSGVGEGA